MGGFGIISAIGLPLLMAIGGIAAWRMTKKENSTEIEKPAWRDTSLDDWRKQRDADADVERKQRAENPAALHEGAAAEEQAKTQRHQRIGG